MAVLLECFQDRHLSLVVPRCFRSNPVLMVFTGKYISGSIFQCPLVNLLAFPSNHSVVMVAHSASQDWASALGGLFDLPDSRRQDLGAGEGV